jgi:succinate-semialdehyde dehydrogenase/glutarate-semialdehyde dehydrogenase/succinate-semialdehyde dehydrogenase
MNAFTSCNPATAEVVFTRPGWSRDQLDHTLDRLKAAQSRWASLPVAQRAEQLLQLATQLEAHREQLAALVTLEVGKRTAECLAEIDKSAQLIRYYAELAPTLLAPQAIPTQASQSGVAFEPLGCVLAVMPWNYPIWQLLRFAVPALMAGNTCLVKPAPRCRNARSCYWNWCRQPGWIVWTLPGLITNWLKKPSGVAMPWPLPVPPIPDASLPAWQASI